MSKIKERNRINQIEPSPEGWRPPLFRVGTSPWDKFVAKVRRLFDLQASSIWRDLGDILPTCSGDVVDVGCGAQPYRELFPAEAHYRGIDTEKVPEEFGYVVPDTTYYDGKRWPLEDGSVDVALATETLEHVESVSGFLSEAARCIRSPNGRLILTVPFSARWHFIPWDYWRFTPSGLLTILRPHRFTVTHIWARGNALTVACYKIMALILPLLFSSDRNPIRRFTSKALGFACSPVLTVSALVGNLSLRSSGGDDCLGYTIVAVLAKD